MTDHILKKIDAEIASLRGRLLAMADLAQEQLDDATTLVNKCYLERGVSTDRLEERIDELQAAIDRDSVHFIALHKPSAGDLRVALSIMRTEADLEAIGNASCQIARAGERIHKGARREIAEPNQLACLFDQVKELVSSCITGFAKTEAASLLHAKQRLAQLTNDTQAYRQTIIAALSSATTNATVMVELLDIVQWIERIAYLAKGIAIHTAFMVTGVDLRNAETAEIEKVLADAKANA